MYTRVPSQSSSMSSTPVASPRHHPTSWAPASFSTPANAVASTTPPPFPGAPVARSTYDDTVDGNSTTSSRSSSSHSGTSSISWQQRLLRDPPSLPGSVDFKSRHLHQNSADSCATKMFPLSRSHTSTGTGETVSPPFTPRQALSRSDYVDDSTENQSIVSGYTNTSAPSLGSWQRRSLGLPRGARTQGPLYRAQTGTSTVYSSSGDPTPPHARQRKFSTPMSISSTDVGVDVAAFRKRGRTQPGRAQTSVHSGAATPSPLARGRSGSVDRRGGANDRYARLARSRTSPTPGRAPARRAASAGPSKYRGSARRAPHLDKESLRRTIREKLKNLAPKQEQQITFMTVTRDNNEASKDIVSSLFPLKNEKDVSGKYRKLAVSSPVSLGRSITVLWHDVSPAKGKKQKSVPFKKPDVCLVIVDMKEHSQDKAYLPALLSIPKAHFAKRFAYKCGMVVVRNSVKVTKQLLACEEYDCPCKKFVASDEPSMFEGESICAKCPHSRDLHLMEEEKALTTRKLETINMMKSEIRGISDGIVDAFQTKGANARKSMRRVVSLSLHRKPVVKTVNVPVLESTDDECFNDKKRLASLWLHLFMGLDSNKLYAFYMATDLPEELSRGNLETVLVRVSETPKK